MTTTIQGLSWPKHTQRLMIRPAVAADAAATWRLRGDLDVARWMTTLPPDEGAHIEHFRVPDRLAKTLVVLRQNEIVGDLMLAVEDGWAQNEVTDQAVGVHAELGWVIAPSHAGRGYATEAVRELLRIGFDELGLRRVHATCFADNERSWRLMERVGMRRESYTVQDSLHREFGWVDGMTYALLADEWLVRQR
ncbi:MAG: GNAT family N-acetyltransferase [Nocardioides sp.]